MRDTGDMINSFVVRMRKLGITFELVSNFPWVYITSINGKKVTEKFEGNHGFTVAFLPIRNGQSMKFTDLRTIFKLIRKYATEENKGV